MLNFTHRIPTEIRFGKDVTDGLPEVLGRFGRNILLVYGGGSVKRSGLYDRLVSLLTGAGFTVTDCPGVEPNPTVASVRRGVDLCRTKDIDAVLAIGGGSVIDCGKAIATGRYWEGDLWEMVLQSRDFEFNHLSKRKRASPAHVSFKNVHCFSILGFLSCLVHLALIVKINENYIKIHRYQKGQLLFLKSSFHLVEHEL